MKTRFQICLATAIFNSMIVSLDCVNLIKGKAPPFAIFSTVLDLVFFTVAAFVFMFFALRARRQLIADKNRDKLRSAHVLSTNSQNKKVTLQIRAKLVDDIHEFCLSLLDWLEGDMVTHDQNKFDSGMWEVTILTNKEETAVRNAAKAIAEVTGVTLLG